MENTEAQRAINLATDLAASRQECDMLYRELSKVRDELITSKTERRVLSRWYEDAKGERDKLHSELVEVRSALASVSAERDSLKRTLDEWSNAETKPHARIDADDIADHVVPPVCFDCGSRLVNVGGLLSLCRSAECLKRLPTGAP